MKNAFEPDYTNVLKVLYNERPPRLPLYEHNIDLPFIEKYIGEEIPFGNTSKDFEEHYRKVTGFWKNNEYDAFSYEALVCEVFPGHGAIRGGMKGPIQNREDFEKFPFDEIPALFWKKYTPHFEAIRKVMPAGMKAYGGCGYGIFEASEDLVGFEYLCLMQYEDPDLFSDLYQKIGDLYVKLWSELIKRYNDIFVFYRMGDDLGFKSSTLLAPDTIREFILPQYKRVIDLIHLNDKKFLLHSCGCIFDVMDDIIDLGIDAKHSNEDQIAPFEKWIDLYNNRIGLFGGFDLNLLVLNKYDDIYREVLEKGTKFRSMAKGYGLGSGNSIPGYIPVEGFQAMVDAAQEIRRREKSI
jgi:uroporphyrinogen decarboxylase